MELFFTGSDTGSWICQQDSHEHFRHFEYLIAATAEILPEIWQLTILVHFGTWWRYQWHHECSFIKDYTGPTLRSPCIVIDDVITTQNTFSGITWDDLVISQIKLKACLIFKICEMAAIFRSRQICLPHVIPEVEYASKIAISISNILSFWSTL